MIPRVCHCLSFVAFYQGQKQTKKSIILSHFSNLTFLFRPFITADVLNSARFDFASFCKLLIGFLWASSAHKFSLTKMASEAQKPLAKMEFLLVCG